ncbi:MAG: hypothetical protein V4520_08775 [Bacteroidota bacterium]
MGSGKKRKDNDQVIIRIPKAIESNIPADSGEQAAEICKPSFDVVITNKAFTIKNVSVELVLIDSRYRVYLSGTELAKLTDRQSSMIIKCGELGVKYKGSIVEEKGETYARFLRVA